MHLQLSLPFISFFPISTPGLNFGQATAVAVVVNAVAVVIRCCGVDRGAAVVAVCARGCLAARGLTACACAGPGDSTADDAVAVAVAMVVNRCGVSDGGAYFIGIAAFIS